MENHNQNVAPLTAQSAKPPAVSLRDQSLSTIRAAILSPSDDGETLARANTCLALYFDPDTDAETRRDMRAAFVRALHHVPAWAMHKAFDTWERSMQRRPSPGEIVILAERELKPLLREIQNRTAPPPEIDRQPVSAEAANDILARAGFTPQRMAAVRAAPMAVSFADAETRVSVQRKPHWSETADQDGPEWRQLRASRAASGLCDPKA